MAEITYHKSHTFIDNKDIEHSFITQLYKIGVYGILNNDSNMQINYDPQNIVKIEKGLKKQLKNKEIKSFKLGTPITVSDESGFWEEILD